MNENLLRARRLLNGVTPLKTDCGRCCGAACCQESEEEQIGMLLFPGEEELYLGREDYTVIPLPRGNLLICGGTCDREERPLSCRIFPLLPVIRGDEVKTVTDLRAKGVCPLARQGKSALDPEFVHRVQEVGELLAKDDIQKHFLEELTAEQDELRELKNRFGGSRSCT